MNLIASAEEKMIAFYEGNLSDIYHFLKVHALARLIGQLEGLDEKTQTTLELAAIAHDIACPLCRRKYGNAAGHLQEAESEPLVRDFFAEFQADSAMVERIVYLVTHHHTTANVSGADYQILLEADFLVNAGESEKWAAKAADFRKNVLKTAAGFRLFDEMIPD